MIKYFDKIPDDWQIKKLNNLCDIHGQYGLNEAAVPFDENLPLYLRITDFDETGNLNENSLMSVKTKEIEKYELNDGDILFARTGASTGKTFLYQDSEYEFVFAGFLIRFHVNPNIANPYFIKQLLETQEYYRWVNVMSVRSGQPGINSNEYGNLKLPLPPLQEQKKITDILSTWDHAIELNRTLLNSLLDRKYTLSNKLLFFGHKLYSNSQKINISLQDLIDKKFVRLIKPSDTKRFKSLTYISTSSIQKDSIVSDEGFVSFENRPSRAQLVPLNNSLFFAKMKDSIKVYLFNETDMNKYILSTGYFGFDINDKKLNPEYLKQLLLSKKFNYIKDKISEGSSQSGVKNSHLADLFIPFYKKEIQDEIACILKKCDQEINLVENKLEEYQLQKKGLMQRLLTGQVRVQV